MRNCKQCNTTILKKKNIFCSRECYWLNKKGKSFTNGGSFKKGQKSWNAGTVKTNMCATCKKEYKRYSNKGIKYCSKKCMAENKEWKDKVTKNLLMTSEDYTPEIRKKLSDKRAGKTPTWMSDPIKKARFIKNSSKAKKGIPSKRKGCKQPQSAGSNHPNWKGGVTSHDKLERIKFRRTIQKLVLERDDYTCQMCNERGGKLQVDHIQSWKDYVELRFEMNNLRTLCMSCHYKITFGTDMPEGVTTWGHNLSQKAGY